MRKVDNLGIVCPNCGKITNGDVIDTRPTYDARRRRRVCEHCGKRYTTFERCTTKQRKYFYTIRGEENAGKQTR